MMDSNYMNMHLTVDRYLRGTLTENEQAEFEERLLWDEELVDELDLAERLREGLQAAVEHDDFTARAGAFDWLSRFLFVPQYAAAASFLLAVALSVSIFMSPLVRDDAHATRTDIIPLIATRSSDRQTIAVKDSNWIVLLVDVTGRNDSYRVTVRKDVDGAEPFWLQDDLTSSYPDALAVGMPGSALAAGVYVLSVDGAHVDDMGARTFEHVQDIRFTTIAAD